MNANGKKKRLAIIDPGLMRASGHHAALASLIANGTLGTDWQVDYLCHRLVSDDIRCSLEQAGCRVLTEFDINFYANFNQPVGIGDIQAYLGQAVKEYEVAIELATQTDDDVICFYPSINWDHALALALALEHLGHRPGITHLCCAMFNPGINHQGHALDMRLELNARIAFNALARCAGVEILASDGELSWKYARLLARPIALHPCYLTDWTKMPTMQGQTGTSVNTEEKTRRITLYLGEAKLDKGFCRLPALVKHLLIETNREVEIYIQYTHVWPDPMVERTAAELAAIAKKEPGLILEEDFLTDEQFHQRLQVSDIFVFTYDKAAYDQKNSGILYFVVWYGIPTFFLVETWLYREAKRLGLSQIRVCEGITLADAVNSLSENAIEDISTVSDYREQVYQPVEKWLNDRITEVDNEQYAATY